MFNLSDIVINSTEMNISVNSDNNTECNASNNDKFPTIGLKSLLQNSELLDMLLKPLKTTPSSESQDSKQGKLSPSKQTPSVDELVSSGSSKPDLPDIIIEETPKELLFDWELESKQCNNNHQKYYESIVIISSLNIIDTLKNMGGVYHYIFVSLLGLGPS
jgi:hypothetical protein